MTYIYAFLFCGIICLLAQLILDSSNLTAGHITSIFVVVGSFLDIFHFYDKIIDYCGGGAMVPITSFGHLLSHGAISGANEYGVIGILISTLELTSAGIVSAIIFSFTFSLIFKPKD